MRIREGEKLSTVIPKIRAAAEKAAMNLIDRVQKDKGGKRSFEEWFINLPEYDEFEKILNRLDDAVTE